MSKRFILVFLMIVLTSACTQQVNVVVPTSEEVQNTQPVSSGTKESETTSPEPVVTEKALPHPTFVPTIAPADTATEVFSACPGAPGPYAAIGKTVTVVAEDADKLKLRSEPKTLPETVKRELNRFTQLQIMDGPVCVRDAQVPYWYWQVKVLPDGETGWVAEGDVRHSFIVVSVGQVYVPPTATAYTPPTPSKCLVSHAAFSTGMPVIVIAANSDKLKLRSEPKISPDTILRRLDQFTSLQIVDGPVCVTDSEVGISYWFWKVKVISTGKTGWVAEGDGQNYYLEPHTP